MGSRAGPVPVFRFGHHRGAHRIELRIAQGFPEVSFIQRTGIVTTLPNMSSRVVECVPVGSKPAVSLFQRWCQNVGLPRDCDEMDIVRHQAIANESYPMEIQAL